MGFEAVAVAAGGQDVEQLEVELGILGILL
jgi:hypothetical protein